MNLHPQEIKPYQQYYFNDAQRAYLKALSMLDTQKEKDGLNDVVARYFNELMQQEFERLRESGEFTEEDLEQLSKQHLRTPYKS